MFSLLREFIRRSGRPVTVIVVDRDDIEPPLHHDVNTGRLAWILGGGIVVTSFLLVAVVVFTPIRGILPGFATLDIVREARQNDLRLQAMGDSLARQQEYVNRLRDMILGRVDTSAVRDTRVPDLAVPAGESFDESLSSDDWQDHEQPAVNFNRLGLRTSPARPVVNLGSSTLSALSLPALPPVSGVFTRGYDARTGHFAIDLAVDEGSVVRSIGDGYVVLVDWTHDGGQIIAVQHADGFLSVYKHNSAVLKRVGDRVSDREAIARSGNSGEITSGPHLHFELWHDGLAQDPSYYLIGL